MEKKLQITYLAKTFNNTPIPFVPLVVVGIIVATYANSMSNLYFCKNIPSVIYSFHLFLSLNFLCLLYRYYKYMEILSDFDGVDNCRSDKISLEYNRKVVDRLERELYDKLPARVFLLMLYYLLWFFINDMYSIFNIYDYKITSFSAVIFSILSFSAIIFVMESPLWTSFYYYKKALKYKMLQQKDPMGTISQ